MKKLIVMLMVLSLAIPVFAITADETKSEDTTTISITFTNDEYDLFSLDKGDPKEWIRNACDVNMVYHTQRIKADLTKDIIPSEADFKAKVEELKSKKEKHSIGRDMKKQ
jgi:hypothetical protein